MSTDNADSSRRITRKQFLGASAAAGAGAALAWNHPLSGVAYAQGRGRGLTVASVTTEYAENPLGIDDPQPRLGWLLESGERNQAQSAYRVLVASSEGRLANDTGDVWDSGRVESHRSVNVAYEGPELESRRRYYWKVRTWDKYGAPSGWSESACWEMGLLEEDDWQAEWIGVRQSQDKGDEEETSPAPLLRREFNVEKPVERARVYVCGLGYYVMHLNGEKVGDRVLDPSHPDYEERVLYETYDVGEYLKRDVNAIGVELGRGFYGMTTPNTWNWHEAPWNAEPRLLLQLEVEYADGTAERMVTDEAWRSARGPTVFDSLYEGETYDARREKPGWDTPGYEASGWEQSAVVDAPEGRLVAQQLEPEQVVETLAPVEIAEHEDGVYVFDMGLVTAGWTRLSVSGSAGTEISLKYGEKLNDDGTVQAENPLVETDRFQRDEYILKGEVQEEWEPSFSYKGFRYVQVEGLPEAPTTEMLEGRVVHTAVETVGGFESSSRLYNWIHEAMQDTTLNNLHGIPTDTPMYEKNGWTGDAQLCARIMIYNFAMARFFTKWLDDIRDSQREDGQLPVIVPSPGWGYSSEDLGRSPTWTAAYPILAWDMYRNYGDRQILESHYEAIKKYIEWEIDRLDDGIASTTLGDWLPPGGNPPPEDSRLTATAYVYKELKILADIARELGADGDARRYEGLSGEVRASFNEEFLDRSRGFYDTDPDVEYRQTSNAVPLSFGMVPEGYERSVAESLVNDIRERGGNLNTGVLGTKELLPVLTEYGYQDVAHTVASQRDYPSWGFWFENGATTLWEEWERDSRSYDHYFFGTIDQWFYEYVAGIRAAAPGYERTTIKPEAPGDLSSASASTETVRGRVSSSWRIVGRGNFMLDVEIPVNATAEVHVPAEDERLVRAAPPRGVEFLRMEDGYAVFEVGSGKYKFISRNRSRGPRQPLNRGRPSKAARDSDSNR